MAQTGYTPIQLYYSSTTGNIPSAGNLLSGELAINIADGKLFYKNSGGVVSEVAGGISYVLKTSNYTAINKQGVLADTTGGAFTITLPASPATGDQVVIADAAATWGTNNLTIGRNGATIAGSATDLTCDISGISVQLVYSGTTWDVYAQVGGNGGTAVTLAGVQTLTNKTIAYSSNTLTGVAGTAVANTFSATQTLNGTSSTFGVALLDAAETVSVVGSAPASTTNLYVQSGSIQYYTSNAANNFVVNLAFSSGTTMNAALFTGQSATATLVTTQSSTAYYATSIQVDGTTSGVTTKWIGGAPTAGNASGLDVYRFAVIKTGTSTYTVLASLTQFK